MLFEKTCSSAVLAGSLLAAVAMNGVPSVAFAGECPADKVGVNVMKAGPMQPKDVTDDVLAAFSLGQRYKEFSGQQLRMRRLVIQPGGVVPWHAHPDRPANIYVVDGEVTEFRSTCAVPIVHRPGDVASEFGNLSHWWQNTGNKPAILISADLFKDGMKDEHM